MTVSIIFLSLIVTLILLFLLTVWRGEDENEQKMQDVDVQETWHMLIGLQRRNKTTVARNRVRTRGVQETGSGFRIQSLF